MNCLKRISNTENESCGRYDKYHVTTVNKFDKYIFTDFIKGWECRVLMARNPDFHTVLSDKLKCTRDLPFPIYIYIYRKCRGIPFVSGGLVVRGAHSSVRQAGSFANSLLCFTFWPVTAKSRQQSLDSTRRVAFCVPKERGGLAKVVHVLLSRYHLS